MFRRTVTATVVALGAATILAAPALAGAEFDSSIVALPAPGVLGLIAIGVVGAIAFARSRK